jgi:hypothetical protein
MTLTMRTVAGQLALNPLRREQMYLEENMDLSTTYMLNGGVLTLIACLRVFSYHGGQNDYSCTLKNIQHLFTYDLFTPHQ